MPFKAILTQIRRHPVSQVAPYSLLVPVIGLSAAYALFAESLSALQWFGMRAALLGLMINQFCERFFTVIRRRK